MNPVPRGLETPQEFIAVSPALVEFMGGKIALAAVWEKIRFRCNGPGAVEDEGGNWWECGYSELARLTGMSVSSCRTAVARLEKLGHIESRELKLGDPTDRTKAYRPVWRGPVESGSSGGANASFSRWANAKSSRGLMLEVAVDTSSIEELKRKEGPDDEDPRFTEWYEGYPKKSSRGAARVAFKSALKKADLETLTRGRDLYVTKLKMDKTEKNFIKHASTWLNQECWDDDYGDVKIVPSGFRAWFASVLESANTGEVERVLGLVFPMPDEVPAGVSRVEFLDASRRSWLESVRGQAESRWVVQFGDVLKGP